MSRLKDTFLIKEAAPAPASPVFAAHQQVERLVKATFGKVEQALRRGDRPAAASEARRMATEIQIVFEQLAQEVLQ